MNTKIVIIALLAATILGCNQKTSTPISEEEEEVKFQYTAYSENFELFVEADPFIIGESANILSHFSVLPGFVPVEKAKITAILSVNGKITSQTLDSPVRKGIYSFDITPETTGRGSLKFEISSDTLSAEIVVPDIVVFATSEEAHGAAESIIVSRTNTAVFTKEQSWKIDFSTEVPVKGPFGQVIKSIAFIKAAPDNEVVVTAKTNGIVSFTSGILSEGKDVSKGDILVTISAGNLADNNLSVKYAEAKNNFEKEESEYNRAKELAADKIVSERELLTAKNLYENAKSVYDNLNTNFTVSGQRVASPLSGSVKQVFVDNGAYVETGQSLLTVSQNKTMILTADVPQKYLPYLGSVKSAIIRIVNDPQEYTLEQLNGKIISYGKSGNPDNYLIPVTLQIENNGRFIAGSFVEIFLKTVTENEAITVPNSSILEEQGNYFVYVQINPELFEKRLVEIGTTDGIRSELISGISSGERIVTRGAILIKLAQSTGALDAHSGHVH